MEITGLNDHWPFIANALKGSKSLIKTHLDTKTFYTSHEKEKIFWSSLLRCQGHNKQPKER